MAGDILVVTKLDRLARSTLDLLRIVDLIGREGAGFKSLGDPWADTTTAHGRLMPTVLSGIAEFERSLYPAKERPRSRHGRRHTIRPEAEADQASSAGSFEACGSRRAAKRDRIKLSFRHGQERPGLFVRARKRFGRGSSKSWAARDKC